MQVIEKEVLLLKAQSDDGPDKYETLLIKNNFTVKYLEVLKFEFVNLSLLKTKLNDIDTYNGIIFTSPRAVLATKLALGDTELNRKWSEKNNYVVGESTYDLVKNKLHIMCKGQNSGNANNLAELIIKENCVEKYTQFLFPCGNLKKETLGKCLSEHNIKLDASIVYESVENNNILDDLKHISNDFKTISEYLVYFSPSGVKNTTKFFKDLAVPFSKLKLIAIGPSTEEALRLENLPVYAVSVKPTETELLNAILNENKV